MDCKMTTESHNKFEEWLNILGTSENMDPKYKELTYHGWLARQSEIDALREKLEIAEKQIRQLHNLISPENLPQHLWSEERRSCEAVRQTELIRQMEDKS